MSALDSLTVELPELKTRATHAGDCVTIAFDGSADLEVRAALESTLTKLHDEVVSLGARRVIVDFVKLEFMNSSCFKSFLGWINRASALEPAQQYRIAFIPNERFHWQQRSLHAMRCFAVNMITIEKR